MTQQSIKLTIKKGDIVVTLTKTKPVPLDVKEVTDVLAGVHAEEDYGSFMRGRDVRRRALPEELPEDINGEPTLNASFGNFRKINF